MKTDILLRTVMIALLGSASACAIAPHTPLTAQACNKAKMNSGAYRFYGARAPMLQDIATIPLVTIQRRTFLQITQGDSGAEVKFYERQENGTFTITVWKVAKASRLLADVDQAIVDNKGVNCIGEQIKAVLAKDLKDGLVTTGVAAPVSPMAAFAHSVKDADGDFIQTTVIILC